MPSASHLILKLRAIAQHLNRTPTTADIIAVSKAGRGYSLDAYYAVFGSFTEAIRRAHLTARYNQEFDKEKLLDELKILRSELKCALIARDVQAARQKNRVSSLYHFQRAFGSVPNTIAEAGAGRRAFTRSEIKDYLKKLEIELKREPRGKDLAARYVAGETPSLKEVLRAFKTLARAKK